MASPGGFGVASGRSRSALAVAAALFAYAHFAGTPYQAAKSIVIAAPLAMLIAARALISGEPAIPLSGLRGAVAGGGAGRWASGPAGSRGLRPLLATAFVGAAAGCSLLALANGPVGPATYSPALTELRGRLGDGSTLVLGPGARARRRARSRLRRLGAPRGPRLRRRRRARRPLDAARRRRRT